MSGQIDLDLGVLRIGLRKALRNREGPLIKVDGFIHPSGIFERFAHSCQRQILVAPRSGGFGKLIEYRKADAILLQSLINVILAQCVGEFAVGNCEIALGFAIIGMCCCELFANCQRLAEGNKRAFLV